MDEAMRFEHSFIEADAGYDAWGAVCAADFDGDGRPEFATGGKGGGFYHLYDLHPTTPRWTRHVITRAFSPNVGAAATDLDGDGRPEIVCGEWGDRLLYLRPPAAGLEDWSWHVVGKGLRDPHDVLAADLDGDGRDEVIVREKDGPLHLFRPPADLCQPWEDSIIAERLPGDGTCVARLGGRGLSLVTNAGWFENVTGDASVWRRHPLLEERLNWHPESRLAVADLDADGLAEIVITESEVPRARLAVLHPGPPGEPWKADIVLPAEMDLRALHSLQVADLDGDGSLEIFTAEMENRKTDGLRARPRWWCLARGRDWSWSRHILLDANLGTHCAVVADFDGDGRPDIVGKVWRANALNGAGGRNHVDFLRNVTPLLADEEADRCQEGGRESRVRG